MELGTLIKGYAMSLQVEARNLDYGYPQTPKPWHQGPASTTEVPLIRVLWWPYSSVGRYLQVFLRVQAPTI